MDETIRCDSFYFGIVVSMFNPSVTDRLLKGAMNALVHAGVPDDHVRVVRVPGAFEIPVVAQQLAQSKRYHAIVCLGAVIRGETPHFEYISAEVVRGIGQVALACRIPVIFGVLTTDTVDQADARSMLGGHNKGFEAGVAAVEMARLWPTLRSG